MKNKWIWAAKLSATIFIGGLFIFPFFDRPTPTSTEYLQKYLPELKQEDIKSIKLSYSGAFGGFTSLARIEVTDCEYLQSFWGAPKQKEFTFDQSMSELEIEYIKSVLSMAAGDAGQELPKWMGMDFNEPLYEMSDIKNGRYWRTFFLRKGSPVFYAIISGE
jgi:hypothetical protein